MTAVHTSAAAQAQQRTDAASRTAQRNDPARDPATQPATFLQLLQGLEAAPTAGEAAPDPLTADSAASHLPELPHPHETLALSPDTLVGQTRLLDMQGDIALRDGTHALRRAGHAAALPGNMAAYIAGAQLGTASGQVAATVAMGNQPASESAAALAPASAVTTQAIAIDAGIQTLHTAAADSAGTVQDTPAPRDDARDSSQQGRITLGSAWRLEAEPTPALQRLMGQIEQWAATGAGIQSAGRGIPGGSDPQTAPAQDPAILHHTGGSGTRLTENAVQETVRTAEAALADTQQPPEAPLQDLRFWLQGRQQRAEVLLHHDGEPVRVQVALDGNTAHITFTSDQTHTREALDASLAQLRGMLAQQGLELAGADVRAGVGQDSRDDLPQQPGRAAVLHPPERAGTAHIAAAADAASLAALARQTARAGLDIYA